MADDHGVTGKGLAGAVDATVIDLDGTPRGYADPDSGVARKQVVDPHGGRGEAA